ncbi:hypothetical protein GS909_20025 [Rhodococcus hoagii]|nr:hypothetical protein [Prescottella equi]
MCDPKWGDVKLNKITGHGIQVVAPRTQGAGLSASSVQKCFHLLSSSLRAAEFARMIPSNRPRG